MDNSTNDPCYTFLDPITGETMTFTVTWQTPLESPLLGSASASASASYPDHTLMETEHREQEQSLVQPCHTFSNLSPLGPPYLNVTLQQSLNSPTSPLGSLDPDHTMMDGGLRELEQEQPLAETMDPSIGPSYARVAGTLEHWGPKTIAEQPLAETMDPSIGPSYTQVSGTLEYWGPKTIAVEVGPHIIIDIML